MNAAPRTQNVITALVGLSLVGAAAGCSPSDDGPVFDTSAEYADGNYSATGSYQSPGGRERIDLELTLENDIITALAVHPHGLSPTAIEFETAFAEGVVVEVVGKDIDTLDVRRVGGSSLTSGGFRRALEDIKKDALN